MRSLDCQQPRVLFLADDLDAAEAAVLKLGTTKHEHHRAGHGFEEHIAALDLDAMGGPAEWATGSDPAPVWLDVARRVRTATS